MNDVQVHGFLKQSEHHLLWLLQLRTHVSNELIFLNQKFSFARFFEKLRLELFEVVSDQLTLVLAVYNGLESFHNEMIFVT